jgi:hypothetical protein
MNLLRGLALIAALVAVLLGARWARSVLFNAGDRPTRVAPSPTAAGPTATPSPSPPVILHRLAGTALGHTRYAVVAQPDGSTALYRFGDEVPGLGRIVEVTENSATFDGSAGRVRMRITGPPSPTPAPPSPTDGVETATPSTPSTPAPPAPPAGRTATESPPSAAPDRSAS